MTQEKRNDTMASENAPPSAMDSWRLDLDLSAYVRQLRLGLLANGITTAQVEAVIAAIPNEIYREMAQIEWADASQYERTHPLVDQIGAAMSLTPEQIDAMWADSANL